MGVEVDLKLFAFANSIQRQHGIFFSSTIVVLWAKTSSFLTISRFGSLANTTITTTRKFVSIVVSSLLSGNPLSTKQWGCICMVFTGLSYQIYLKWQKLQRLQKRKAT
ncbi:hypothetical protein AHAS_Ahas18G0122500 [Arachis hypogaea]